jgi:hypothetical protein
LFDHLRTVIFLIFFLEVILFLEVFVLVEVFVIHGFGLGHEFFFFNVVLIILDQGENINKLFND